VGNTATLVSVSRLDVNKRIDILIDAVAILNQRGRRVRLLLGGTGPATEELKVHARRCFVEDIVSFLGYVPEADIPALYAGMDLFVTIDWADFRITTYEVLAENRRVIVSDDTDADPKLLQSGYFFVASPDAERLAETIDNALQQPVAWSRDELRRYLQAFTWSAYFDSIDKSISGTGRLQHV
jgi:glycosyltransferase involved in cell wall biosynthesis